MKPSIFCPDCGVELEADMEYCPLCGRAVNSPVVPGEELQKKMPAAHASFYAPTGRMSPPQKKVTWEVVTIILLSLIIATGIIDVSINRQITWSEYPIAICLVIFAYISFFAFWAQTTLVQLGAGCLMAALLLFALDTFLSGTAWVLKLGIPILFLANIILGLFLVIIRRTRQKGLNLIAYAFVLTAMLCVGIEAILRVYLQHAFRLQWSIIVVACVLPVCVVLLFMHFRYKKGRDLKKTFHI
jgi:hypothetical protein